MGTNEEGKPEESSSGLSAFWLRPLKFLFAQNQRVPLPTDSLNHGVTEFNQTPEARITAFDFFAVVGGVTQRRSVARKKKRRRVQFVAINRDSMR